MNGWRHLFSVLRFKKVDGKISLAPVRQNIKYGPHLFRMEYLLSIKVYKVNIIISFDIYRIKEINSNNFSRYVLLYVHWFYDIIPLMIQANYNVSNQTDNMSPIFVCTPIQYCTIQVSHQLFAINNTIEIVFHANINCSPTNYS